MYLLIRSMASSLRWRAAALCLCVAALPVAAPGLATAQQPEATPAQTPAAAETQNPAADQAGGITEEQLRQMLTGKPLYLCNCYLDNTLSFNEHGGVTGHPTPGSYTLCGVEIRKIRLTKHKVEFYGDRYGLHFLGALPYEDPTRSFDRVRITPKKKVLRITLDREIVVKPRKAKGKKPGKEGALPTTPNTDASAGKDEPSEAEQLNASIAAAPEAEKPADLSSVTTTTSPAHAAQTLRDALDKVFAPSLDDRMMAGMPPFWKLYYQAAATHADYHPQDPAVLHQNTVDRKARLLTSFEPASNEFAQASGVAGMALYRAVIGADGKPGEIAVARPIGFGLDENAVEAIRNARFEPALKDGKPVPVLLDLVVQFRIFSNRTAVKSTLPTADKPIGPQPGASPASTAPAPSTPVLPGPYSREQR